MSLGTLSESFATGWRRRNFECAVSSAKMGLQRLHRTTLWTRRDESRQFCETYFRATIWVTLSLTSNKQRKQIRATVPHTFITDHKFDSVRPAAQTIEHYMFKIHDQRSHFELMNKDDYDEIGRFSGLSLFHNTDKQTKLAEQWKNVHWMVKLTRTEEHLLAIKCEPRSRNKNEENLMINSRKIVTNSGNWAVPKQYRVFFRSQK